MTLLEKTRNLTVAETVYTDWKARRFSSQFIVLVMEAISRGNGYQRHQMRKAFPDLVDTLEHASNDPYYEATICEISDKIHRCGTPLSSW